MRMPEVRVMWFEVGPPLLAFRCIRIRKEREAEPESRPLLSHLITVTKRRKDTREVRLPFVRVSFLY